MEAGHNGGPTTIVLMRHAQTAHNSEGRFQGRLDAPLDDIGMQQAHDCAAALSAGAFGMQFDAIYTSTLVRASATADIIASHLGLKAERMRELMEIDCGEVSDLTVSEAKRRYPEVMDRFASGWWETPYPGGQSHSSYEKENVLPAIGKIAGLWPGGRVLAVTHGGFIRTAALNFLGIGELRPFLSYRLDNCGLTTIEVRLAGARIDGRMREFNLNLGAVAGPVLDVYSKEGDLR